MTSQLEALDDWASGLLGQLEPAARAKLVRSIAQTLRRCQQQRIIAQRNPDSSKYAPRKRRKIREKKGRLKRKMQMFQKLRSTKLLKAYGNGSAVSVGYLGRIGRIARIHQFGLKERAVGTRPEITYSQRQVLGFRKKDLELVRNQLASHLISK
ncbi:phage virion morphogenesis protein [Pseudomonas corrugata]|uniref:Phage virion morphogenesis protein n=1 Tax=Pseudomonas corrugata TaxID=47879 RepID=A0A7Y5ZAI0_9PSED|nr:phage virion morphogenesis protein [Pseudomonas corrugata]NUT88896.1 phage virion morphogenesis protein [Pseudomonas corrugata]